MKPESQSRWCQLPTCSPALLTEFWILSTQGERSSTQQSVIPLKNAAIVKFTYTWSWTLRTQQKFNYSKVSGSRSLENRYWFPHTRIQAWGLWIWCKLQDNFWHACTYSSNFWSSASSPSKNVHGSLAQIFPFLSVRGPGMGNFQWDEPNRWCKSS